MGGNARELIAVVNVTIIGKVDKPVLRKGTTAVYIEATREMAPIENLLSPQEFDPPVSAPAGVDPGKDLVGQPFCHDQVVQIYPVEGCIDLSSAVKQVEPDTRLVLPPLLRFKPPVDTALGQQCLFGRRH